MLCTYIISGGEHPFAGADSGKQEEKILNSDKNVSSVSDMVANDLVLAMLDSDPVRRPSAAALLR